MTRSSHHRRRKPRASPGRRRPSLASWLLLVVAGGFGGALGALHLIPGTSAAIGAEATPIRASAAPPRGGAEARAARFGLCHRGGGTNCVVDGDTFWFAGEKYRIADIDTPETHPARCAEEAALGAAATQRLRAWLNAGSFALAVRGRATDRYGRKLRIVTRGSESVGDVLIGEGLARRWEGKRRPWC